MVVEASVGLEEVHYQSGLAFPRGQGSGYLRTIQIYVCNHQKRYTTTLCQKRIGIFSYMYIYKHLTEFKASQFVGIVST